MFGIKWRYVFILLLGTYSFLNIKFTQGDTVLTQPISDLGLLTIITLIVISIWEGNHLIARINDRFSYKRISYKLIRHFLSSLLLVSLLTPAFNISINYYLQSASLFEGFNQLIGFSFRITAFCDIS